MSSQRAHVLERKTSAAGTDSAHPQYKPSRADARRTSSSPRDCGGSPCSIRARPGDDRRRSDGHPGQPSAESQQESPVHDPAIGAEGPLQSILGALPMTAPANLISAAPRESKLAAPP